MTVTPVPGKFMVKKKGDYNYADETGRSIDLPGKPYVALRIKRVED